MEIYLFIYFFLFLENSQLFHRTMKKKEKKIKLDTRHLDRKPSTLSLL